jgi:hypothetical protein
MIKLQCEQCGAALETAGASVVVGDGIAIIRSGYELECSHCGMKYAPGDEIGLAAVSQTVIAEEGSTVQGVTQIAGGKFVTVIDNASGIVIGDSGTVVKMNFD